MIFIRVVLFFWNIGLGSILDLGGSFFSDDRGIFIRYLVGLIEKIKIGRENGRCFMGFEVLFYGIYEIFLLDLFGEILGKVGEF